MKKLVALSILIMIILGLLSCNSINGTSVKEEQSLLGVKAKSPKNPMATVKLATEDSIMLIDRFGQKICSYNTKFCQVEDELSVDNFMFYEFVPECEYYTAGSSVDNGFSICRISQEGTTILKEMGLDEGIFPLAYSDKHIFL